MTISPTSLPESGMPRNCGKRGGPSRICTGLRPSSRIQTPKWVFWFLSLIASRRFWLRGVLCPNASDGVHCAYFVRMAGWNAVTSHVFWSLPVSLLLVCGVIGCGAKPQPAVEVPKAAVEEALAAQKECSQRLGSPVELTRMQILHFVSKGATMSDTVNSVDGCQWHEVVFLKHLEKVQK